MATKLKNLVRSWYVKAAAFLLILCCLAGMFLIGWNFMGKLQNGEVDDDLIDLNAQSYLDTYLFHREILSYTDTVRELLELENQPMEEQVTQNVNMELNNAFEMWKSMHEDTDKVYQKMEWSIEQNRLFLDIINLPEDEATKVLEKKEITYKNFSSIYSKEIAEFKESTKKYLNQRHEELLYNLNQEKDFVYQIVSKENTKEIKKAKATFESLPFYCYKIPNQAGESKGHSYYEVDDNNTKQAIFIGLTEAYNNQQTRLFNETREQFKNSISAVISLAIFLICAFIYLIVVTGRIPTKSEVHLYPVDRIFSELIWAVGVFSLIGAGFCIYQMIENQGAQDWLMKFTLVGLLICSAVSLECSLTQIRRLKARKFWSGFAVIRFIQKMLGTMIKGCVYVWRQGTLSRRLIIIAIVLPLVCGTWIGIPFVMAFLIYVIYRYMGDIKKLTQGTRKIRDGELHYSIYLSHPDGILGELANDINSISQGLDHAVSAELRSERLKAELISNVSHDLKTPLTSIVTYVDLLKKEEILNDTAKDYIAVIDRKVDRLTVLTHDLFEAAKASSGDMPVNLETVDFNSIIRQALGEFDEKLQRADLEVRTKLMDGSAYIRADGRLTWRVLDNLLGNVIKYGQPGSRVYMELEEEGQNLRFVMKNVSAYELNIPVEELMERFTRGDESRSSEGSGLGLNIANSLITLQHGSFSASIDGDLFKVSIWLPKAMKEDFKSLEVMKI